MTTCRCEHLPGEALQQRAHAAHTQIAQLAQRYLPFVRAKPRDPDLEVLLNHTRTRLRALHEAAEPFLPDVEPSRRVPFQPSVTRQHYPQHRRRHDEHPPHAD